MSAKLVAALGVGVLVAALSVVDSPASAAPATSGTFSVLTYNVAGLPEGLSSGHPATNTKPIGQRINGYDIVNVQEDFNYHADLYSTDQHPYRTPTSGGAGIGDGLNTVSNYPYRDFERDRWGACNGTDCLTPKGFTWSRIRLTEGVYLDLYNLHPNAGTADADLSARRSNISQLSSFIASHSAGTAVLVMGDTNTRYTRTGDNIRDLVAANGLTDVWVQAVRGGTPPTGPDLVCDPSHVDNACEVVDKIFYRGSRYLNLSLSAYNNEHARFLDANGAMLSDHDPVTARFAWTLNPTLRLSDVFGGPHGTPFTDLGSPLAGAVRQVSIRTGSRVDQVGLDGRVHGGTGGTAHTLTLATGEYVSQVRLDEGQVGGRTRIFFVELRTNLGHTLSGGTRTADTVTFTAPAGWQLAGFHGRTGDEVDQLGLIYTPVTA